MNETSALYYKALCIRVAPLWGVSTAVRGRGVALAIALRLAFTYFIGSDLVNT